MELKQMTQLRSHVVIGGYNLSEAPCNMSVTLRGGQQAWWDGVLLQLSCFKQRWHTQEGDTLLVYVSREGRSVTVKFYNNTIQATNHVCEHAQGLCAWCYLMNWYLFGNYCQSVFCRRWWSKTHICFMKHRLCCCCKIIIKTIMKVLVLMVLRFSNELWHVFQVIPWSCSTGLFSMTSGNRPISGMDRGAGCSAKIASVWPVMLGGVGDSV